MEDSDLRYRRFHCACPCCQRTDIATDLGGALTEATLRHQPARCPCGWTGSVDGLLPVAAALTLGDVEAWVARIRASADDGEDVDAHVEQDRLWQTALLAIAAGAQPARELAALAAAAGRIGFARWYE